MNDNFRTGIRESYICYVLNLFFFLFSVDPGFARSFFPEEINACFVSGINSVYGFETEEHFFKIDIKAMKTQLSAVPDEQNFRKYSSKITLEIPLPSGKKKVYAVAEAPIMDASGEQLYDYKAYIAYRLKSGEPVGRFSLSKNGVNGIFEEKGRLFSVQSVDNHIHKSVYGHQADLQEGCQMFSSDSHKHSNNTNFQNKQSDLRFGDRLRIFRIAVTNRGELYDRAVQTGKDLPTVLADYVNQVNFIYEKELSVRLEVVTPIQFFTNKNTDPFTSSNTFNLITESRQAIDSMYAGVDYDLGHLFSYFGGGRAYLNSVCGGLKSGAVTGMDLPLSSSFLRLFAHELGHQFGAGHSFNSDQNFCGDNLFVASAYEIGSGSTIMSYAGSCSGENVEHTRSSFFNAGALEEMNTFIENKIAQGCGRAVFISNHPPNVEAPQAKTIPARTPFFLEGTGSDADRNSLIYSWEQHDLGPVGLLGSEAAGRPSVPLFRVFDPTESPVRFFPEIDAILQNDNQATWEILPETNRELNFLLTGRDCQGGVSCSEVKLQVYDSGRPFKIQSFNAPETVQGGTSALIQWDVAETNRSPISTSHVDIMLSLDGGQSFPIALKNDTPNDGEEIIQFPTESAENVRIMVRAKDNYFFDINNGNLKLEEGINPPPEPDKLELTFSASPVYYRQFSNVVFDVSIENKGTQAVNDLKISIPTIPGKLVFGHAVALYGNYNSFFEYWEIPSITPGQIVDLKLTFFTLEKDENLIITASQIGGALSQSVTLYPESGGGVPDLFLTIDNSPSEAEEGQFLTANLQLHNAGTSTASGDYTIGIYLSEDDVLDVGDELIGSIATGNTPITSLPTTAGFFVPTNKDSGDYSLIYFVDNQSVINELNEENNTVFASLKIKGNEPPAGCSISSIISNKRCDDNDTGNDPSDDRFYFDLNLTNMNSVTGWHADIGGINLAGDYGSNYTFGPFDIASGDVQVYVEDIDNAFCNSNFSVRVTPTCSDENLPEYCESKSDFPWHEWIAGVKIGGFQKLSGKSTYSDFSDKSIPVFPGQNMPLELTTAYSWFAEDCYFRVWIDADKNGEFISSEIAFQTILPAPPDGTPIEVLQDSFSIPSFSGKTKMRISMKRGSFPAPCELIDFGEVEDYLIEGR